MRVALATVIVLLFQGSSGAQVPACPSKDPDMDGCEEGCPLPPVADEQASEAFTGKLRSIASTRHHIDTVLGDALLRRLTSFSVAPFSLSSDQVRRWTQNQRWAGPCTGLVAVFYSKAVEDKDPKNVVELYELRYQTEAMARRVAALLETSWDWNYHPFVTVLSGRSVIVAEGRHRAWDGVKAVGEHFGGTWRRRRLGVTLPPCDRDAAHRPVYTGEGLAVHVLGFSPSGAIAWLEERAKASGGTRWTLNVDDLMNDRELVARTYVVAKSGVEAFCAHHATEASQLLVEQGVTTGVFSAFERPAPGADPESVLIRPRAGSGSEVVMKGRQGSKVLGKLSGEAAGTQALGFLRSPFEARIAAMALTRAPDGRSVVRVFGGRLDKGWTPEPAPRP